ncbi:hypothetical protein C8Q80DRAFT_1275587 [Daedaleopsis nitida]|nr:hypothetical protein C8Q80DRAFT_1275587 [Daedaleopsis nitida]
MSSDSGSDTAELIATYQSLFVDNACAFAVLALVIYDYAITLGQEIEMFWRRKLTGATALFLLNRYLLVLDYIFNIATIERSSEVAYVSYFPVCHANHPVHHDYGRASCAVLVKAENSLYNVQYRVTSPGQHSRLFNVPVALLVGLLTLVPLGLNMSQFASGLTGMIDPIFGCTEVLPVDPNLAKKRKLHLSLTITSRTTLIVADLILIVVTWRSIPRRKESNQMGMSFAGVLFRDGLLYFVVLFALNALHLIFTMVSIVDPLNPVSNVTIFTLPRVRPSAAQCTARVQMSLLRIADVPRAGADTVSGRATHRITAALVSRFLLDLQQANRKALHLDTRSGSELDSGCSGSDAGGSQGVGSLVFERVVSSIASSLEAPGVDVDEDYEDERWALAEGHSDSGFGSGSGSGTALGSGSDGDKPDVEKMGGAGEREVLELGALGVVEELRA